MNTTRFLLVGALSVMLCAPLAAQDAPINVSGTTVTIDLDKLSPSQAADVLKAKQTADGNRKEIPTAKQVSEWTDVGKGVAEAIAAAAKSLAIGVTEFINTPIGWWTMVFVVFYLVGGKLWAIFGGSILWVVLMVLLWRSYRTFFLGKRTLVRTDPDGTQHYDLKRYQFRDDRGGSEGRAAAAAIHTILFVAATIVCALIVF